MKSKDYPMRVFDYLALSLPSFVDTNSFRPPAGGSAILSYAGRTPSGRRAVIVATSIMPMRRIRGRISPRKINYDFGIHKSRKGEVNEDPHIYLMTRLAPITTLIKSYNSVILNNN